MITSGQVGFIPFRVTTSTPLHNIAEQMASQVFDAAPHGSGWGSIDDPDSDQMVRQPTKSRPTGGPPMVVVDLDPYPDHLIARFYWHETNKPLLRAGIQDEWLLNRLQAVDLVLTDVGNGYWGMFSTKNETSLHGTLLPALRKLLESLDDSTIIDVVDNQYALGDGDLFLWLLNRQEHNPELNDDLSLVDIDELSGRGLDDRGARMGSGVDTTRIDTLTYVGESSSRYGPSKFIVSSTALQLTASVQMSAAGPFSILIGASGYADEIEEDMSDRDKRLRLVRDVSFEIIPEVMRLHNSDRSWLSGGRVAFRDAALSTLRERYA